MRRDEITISFDAYHTLFQESLNHFYQLRKRMGGCSSSTEEIQRTLSDIVLQTVPPRFPTHHKLLMYWYNVYCELCARHKSSCNGVTSILEYTSSERAWDIIPGSFALLKKIQSIGSIRTIVCSDWDESLYMILSGLGVFVEEIYTSASIGYSKSNREYWQKVLEFEPGLCIHIGDDPATDFHPPHPIVGLSIKDPEILMKISKRLNVSYSIFIERA